MSFNSCLIQPWFSKLFIFLYMLINSDKTLHNSVFATLLCLCQCTVGCQHAAARSKEPRGCATVSWCCARGREVACRHSGRFTWHCLSSAGNALLGEQKFLCIVSTAPFELLVVFICINIFLAHSSCICMLILYNINNAWHLYKCSELYTMCLLSV